MSVRTLPTPPPPSSVFRLLSCQAIWVLWLPLDIRFSITVSPQQASPHSAGLFQVGQEGLGKREVLETGLHRSITLGEACCSPAAFHKISARELRVCILGTDICPLPHNLQPQYL